MTACLSAILFIFSLARIIEPDRSKENIYHEHSYTKLPNNEPTNTNKDILWSDLDFLLQDKNNSKFFEIDPKYADDINWVSTNKQRIE